jgi:hypothetical protein
VIVLVDETPVSPASATPTIVYIAGSGRSGSTLLERMIGAIDGFANVGELLDLTWRVAPRDEVCGCGARFSQCGFWSAVGRRAFGGWEPVVLDAVYLQQRQVARQRYLAHLLLARRRSHFAARIDAYASSYATITSAVAAEASASSVVDASKWPAIALALHRGGIDVRVIHLVRDVRGVAHSLSRDDITRPHAGSGDSVMFHHPPAGGAARWLLTQTEVDLMAARGVRTTRLLYSDLVAEPSAALRRCLGELGLEIPAGGLDHVQDRTVHLGPSHGLSGNPSRFRHGTVVLHPDDRWQHEMLNRDKVLAAAIGFPQLIRLTSSRQSRDISGKQR